MGVAGEAAKVAVVGVEVEVEVGTEVVRARHGLRTRPGLALPEGVWATASKLSFRVLGRETARAHGEGLRPGGAIIILSHLSPA